MRRLVEDEVRSRCAKIADRGTEDGKGGARWFRTRELGEPVELTSRESTSSIARARARLVLPHTHDEHVDVLFASNMISISIDIDHLGSHRWWPVSRRPQASAFERHGVGRQAKWPGLVVTALQPARAPRSFALERFHRVARELLPTRRGVEPHALVGARPGAWLRGCAARDGAPRRRRAAPGATA